MKNPIIAVAKFIITRALGKRSPQWQKVRKEHLKLHWWCRYCGSTSNLEVHHIQPFHLNPELELEENNLITLCEGVFRQCHLKQGHLGNWKSFNPDINKIAKARPPLPQKESIF